MVLLASLSRSNLDTGPEKTDSLRILSANTDGFVKFTTTDYMKYVVDYPRPYTLVIYFTVDSSKMSCIQCEEIKELLEQVKYSYSLAKADLPGEGPLGKSRAVFFAVVEYSAETYELFTRHSFASVPVLLVTHPKSVSFSENTFSFPKEDFWESNTAAEIHAQQLLDFVNNRAKRTIELATPPLQALWSLLSSIAGLIALVIVGVFLKKVFLIPHVWFSVAILVYFICISGTVYNIIHHTPIVGYNSETRVIEFIHSGQRNQYAGEGYLMGLTICIGGFGMILLNLGEGAKTGALRVLGLVGLFLTIGSVYQIYIIYQLKANWYGIYFYPPSHYISGPLRNDQGISF